jgi:predicted ATPase/DNA-binding CsgD family transcriptional regulator
VQLLGEESVRLVTLTGPGGVGKTRLAAEVAGRIDDPIARDVRFVSLAAIAEPRLMLPAIADALGVRGGAQVEFFPRIASFLRDRRMLLVLDNFEHLAGNELIVSDLLRAAPLLKMLITSREALGLSGEWQIPVLPFSTSEGVVQNDAVELFRERARAIDASFTLTPENTAVIATICTRLDGLPLAIELAAARIALLPPPALLNLLEHRLPLLTGGPRDAPARQRTMRDAIAWSYELLDAEEQRLFRLLALFAGGSTIASAGAVARSVDTDALLTSIASLMAKSMILRPTQSGGEPRFVMLETIREFGLEQLAASGELATGQSRFTAYFITLAKQAEPAIYGGGEQIAWLDRLSSEQDNLRTALGWLLEHEAAQALEQALSGTSAEHTRARSRSLLGAGMLAHRQGDETHAHERLQECIALARETGDVVGAAFVVGLLGLMAEDAGEYDTASAFFTEGLRLHEANPSLLPPFLVGLTCAHLGVVAWGKGDLTSANTRWEEALAIHQAIHDDWGIANVLGYLALGALEQGAPERALALTRESLALFWKAHSLEEVASVLTNAATIEVARGNHHLAAERYGAAQHLRQDIGSKLNLPERQLHERSIETARQALGASRFDAAFVVGSGLPLDDVVEQLLNAESPSPQPEQPTGNAFDLTPRERDVLGYLIEGMTDREIADALFISPRTVQSHLARLFAKLEVNTRTAAVTVASRMGFSIDAAPDDLPK